DAAVAVGRHAVLDVHGEVGELLLVVAEETVALALADDQPVLDGPDRLRLVALLVLPGALDHPAVEILAVEQVAVLVGGRPQAGGEEQQCDRSPASAVHRYTPPGERRTWGAVPPPRTVAAVMMLPG